MSERFKCPMAVHLFIRKGDKILLQLRKTKSFGGLFGVVAGHLDGGETAVNAAIREAKEEIGVDINPDSLKIATICHSYADNIEYIQLFFWCNEWSGNIENLELEKCEKLEWFDLNNLPKNIVPYITRAFEKSIEGELFYEDYF